MSREKMAVVSHTYNHGWFETENPSAAPQSIVSMLSRLTGDTVQYLSELEGYHALVVSRVGGNSAAERGGVNSFALLFDQRFAEKLLRRPAAAFKVGEFLLEMGGAAAATASLGKIPALLDELEDDSSFCENVPFTPAMLTAYAVALASTKGKNLCFVDDISRDELLAVLSSLPPTLRLNTSWSYGYCKACAPSLKLVSRGAADPKFEIPPSAVACSATDIETILSDILEVELPACKAVLGEGVSPRDVTWSPQLLLKLASWQPPTAPQYETAAAPVSHQRERQQPRACRRSSPTTRNAALSLTRKLVLLICTGILLFYGLRTGSSVTGEGQYLMLYFTLEMADLVRIGAVFLAGVAFGSVLRK